MMSAQPIDEGGKNHSNPFLTPFPYDDFLSHSTRETNLFSFGDMQKKRVATIEQNVKKEQS